MNVFREIMLTFILGFIFAFWFGVQFGKAIEQRKKKKASSKNRRNKISSRKLYQIEGGRSMINVGDIVHASDPFHGSYIGEVVHMRKSPVFTAQVSILACISYPRQHAEFFTDKPAERFPYKYNAIQCFSCDSIGKYVGKIPDYNRSVNIAINNAIKKCRPVELLILLRHCNRKAGESVCVG